MTSILEAREKGLQWISLSRFARRYELRDDSGVVYAKLDFDKLIGRNAVAEGADHRWKIRTEGWLRPLVCMHELGSRKLDGTLQMIVFGWAGKGTLTLKDGQQFRWKPASLLFDREWMFASLADGSAFVSCKKPILRQTGNTNLVRARIEISRSGTSDSLVEILSVLAMYLLG